jgi:hypothetical protein
MNAPSSTQDLSSALPSLEARFAHLQAQKESPRVLVEVIRLHDALVTAAQGMESQEFAIASGLYDQIVAFSGQICATLSGNEAELVQQGLYEEKVENRAMRRRSIQAQNASRARKGRTKSSSMTTEATRALQGKILDQKADQGATYLRQTRDFARTGRRVAA